MAKGWAGNVLLTTDDVHADYEQLRARGVEFTEEPEERPYGIDYRVPRPVGQPVPPDAGSRARPGLSVDVCATEEPRRCGALRLVGKQLDELLWTRVPTAGDQGDTFRCEVLAES